MKPSLRELLENLMMLGLQVQCGLASHCFEKGTR